MTDLIGILDCNNFYASCERVFRPALNKQPIAVLSNNDGCIIARSEEVKRLKIPMAAPVFKWREQLEQHNVKLFSANFVLYGDLSQRVMQILKQELPQVEVYSIDEAFFDLSGMSVGEALSVCRLIKAKIHQWLGLPVSIGLAPNKTLAKLANHIAKKHPQYEGVYYLSKLEDKKSLKKMDVQKLWGVGHKLALSLRAMQINNLHELKRADINWVRRKYSVVMEKAVRELRGEYCFTIDSNQEYKQHICIARSFGNKVNTYQGIRAAVVNFATIACEKLRAQHCWAKSVTVFIRTNPFNEHEEQYRASTSVILTAPSQESHTIVKAAVAGLESIYKVGCTYKKAGVVINDILPKQVVQLALFEQQEKISDLSSVLDKINNKYPYNRESRAAIQFAAVAANDGWRMNQHHRTPRYTSNWQELRQVK